MASRSKGTKRQHTIRQGLEDLGITDATVFATCESRDDEFKVIKKEYHKAARQHHPDKGGDKETFQYIQTSFELLRDLHGGQQQRKNAREDWLFSEALVETDTPKAASKKKKKSPTDEEAFDMSQYDFDFANQETPSWEFYEAAATEEQPPYRMELAKSGRSKCTQKGQKAKKCEQPRTDGMDESSSTAIVAAAAPEVIVKGELRVGWLEPQTGTYGGWKHLRCWRVPNQVWMGLPDPDKCSDPQKFAQALETMNDSILSGFTELPKAVQQAMVDHCRDRSNWTREVKRKAIAAAAPVSPASAASATTQSHDNNGVPSPGKAGAMVATHSTALVVGRQAFGVPKPGVNGASEATVFAGKRFCLTGLFPEIGGGSGLSLGKDRAKQMIEAFGGRVTGSISGKTDVLVVGKDPGFSKVSKARAQSGIHLASLKEIKEGLDAGLASIEEFAFCNREQPMMIQNFSAGFKTREGFNGMALEASKEDLEIAHGLKPHPESAKKKSAKKKAPPPVIMIDDDDDEKPAAKPTKSSRSQKRKALEAVPSGPNVSSDKKKSKKTRGRAAKAKSQANGKSDEEELEDVITCDNCGKECTDESWFVPKTEKDFCPHCYTAGTIQGAVLQRQGKPVLE